jgi:hypothetical protein
MADREVWQRSGGRVRSRFLIVILRELGMAGINQVTGINLTTRKGVVIAASARNQVSIARLRGSSSTRASSFIFIAS